MKEQNIERLRKEGEVLRYYLAFSSRDSRNLHKSRTRTQTWTREPPVDLPTQPKVLLLFLFHYVENLIYSTNLLREIAKRKIYVVFSDPAPAF